MDVALDLGGRLQSDVLRAYDARDFATHHDLLACNHSGDLALLADDDLNGLHVAFDLTVNLKQTAADDFEPLTDNFEIVTYD